MTDPRVSYVLEQLRIRKIKPNNWKRVSNFNKIRDFPPIKEWEYPEELIQHLFKGYTDPLFNMENIEKKEAEEIFNFWGVPKPVWQLLVTIAYEQKNSDQVG